MASIRTRVQAEEIRRGIEHGRYLADRSPRFVSERGEPFRNMKRTLYQKSFVKTWNSVRAKRWTRG